MNMLSKPAIFRLPDASTSLRAGLDACSYYNGHRGFSCSPYGSNCVDASYSPSSGCGWTLGIGAGGAALTVGIGAIAIT